jgi:hypothetical protein
LSCGYRPVYGDLTVGKLSPEVGLVLVPDIVAAQAALSGARQELAADGRLDSGAYPRLAIDILRVDERTRGIHVQSGAPAGSGIDVAVVVRGRVTEAPAQEAAFDTGDVRREVPIASDVDPRAASAEFDQALRSAAEQAGRAVARMALGIPEPSGDAPW